MGSYPGGVTVGYGAGGGDAIEFSLKPGERSDTGFLKLFVSTTSVDMECLEQMFPFDSVKRGGRRKTRQPGDDSIWGAWVAAIRVSGCSKI